MRKYDIQIWLNNGNSNSALRFKNLNPNVKTTEENILYTTKMKLLRLLADHTLYDHMTINGSNTFAFLATCPAHLNLLDLITLTILGERYKL